MDDLEFDLLYPGNDDWLLYLSELEAEYEYVPPPTHEHERPEEWEIQLANAEPHNITVTQYVGYGDDSEERVIEIEVRPNSPTRGEVFG